MFTFTTLTTVQNVNIGPFIVPVMLFLFRMKKGFLLSPSPKKEEKEVDKKEEMDKKEMDKKENIQPEEKKTDIPQPAATKEPKVS